MVIQVKNLSVKYRETQILNNINFSVKQGEIFGMIGPIESVLCKWISLV